MAQREIRFVELKHRVEYLSDEIPHRLTAKMNQRIDEGWKVRDFGVYQEQGEYMLNPVFYALMEWRPEDR